jgi:hypothetical protein
VVQHFSRDVESESKFQQVCTHDVVTSAETPLGTLANQRKSRGCNFAHIAIVETHPEALVALLIRPTLHSEQR